MFATGASKSCRCKAMIVLSEDMLLYEFGFMNVFSLNKALIGIVI